MMWTLVLIAAVIGAGVYLGCQIHRYADIREDAQSAQLILERTKEEIEDAHDTLDSLKSHRNQCVREIDNLQSKKQEYQTELDAVQTNLTECKQTLNQYQRMTEQKYSELQSEYQSKQNVLQQKYDSMEDELRARYVTTGESLKQEQEQEQKKLNELRAKLAAYIQAQQRQEAIAANTDYYRLALDVLEVNDIKLLRELQARFSRKDGIDKLIWETYYKPHYDLLMTHISENKGKICGIYRITSLDNGQSYIGQSVDCRERMRQHIKTALTYGKQTNKLYQAMQKYGPENFTFEILEEIPRTSLNEREKYWIEFYQTKEHGMNSTKGNEDK